MSHLTAIAFNDRHQAHRVLDALRQLEKDALVKLDDVLVIIRDDDGKLRRSKSIDEELPAIASTATGAGLGLVLGALAALPITGLAAGGLLAHRMIARNQLMRQVRQFSTAIEPGMSALFVVGATADAPMLITRLQPFLAGATFLQTDLPDDLLQQVETATAPVTMLERSAIKRVKVIINPASGIERPILRPLNRVLRETGFRWDVALTHQSGDARELAANAAADGYDAVMIYGGDGAVMEAAAGLAGTQVPLAIIPGGTGNVMSVELGIQNDVAAAAELLAREQIPIRDMDLGMVGEHYFALRVATGYEADYVQHTTRESKERLGKLAYALTAMQQELKLVRYTLTLDGETIEPVEGYTCMVANSGNVGVPGLPLLSRISISDGLLDVVIVQNLNFLSLLRPNTSADESAERDLMVRHWQAREITISTDPVQTLIGDGEVWGETPFTATVLPAALRVVVP
jgi:YegS/Rv2252/BmrU family lipid kinase